MGEEEEEEEDDLCLCVLFPPQRVCAILMLFNTYLLYKNSVPVIFSIVPGDNGIVYCNNVEIDVAEVMETGRKKS